MYDLAADLARPRCDHGLWSPIPLAQALPALGGSRRTPDLPARLTSHIEAHRPFPGSQILEALIKELAPRSGQRRSEVEDQFLDLCADYGIPTPESNAIVHGEEVDKLFANFIVELDTWDHHGDPIAFERDRARDAMLAARGLPVVRITGRRMDVERHAVGMQLRVLCGLSGLSGDV